MLDGEGEIEFVRWEREDRYGKYPLGKLRPARRLDDTKRGGIEGESIFIPMTDNPTEHVVRANYMHEPYKFVQRTMFGWIGGKQVKGIRVWKVDPRVPVPSAACEEPPPLVAKERDKPMFRFGVGAARQLRTSRRSRRLSSAK